jgi:hypothetical protein
VFAAVNACGAACPALREDSFDRGLSDKLRHTRRTGSTTSVLVP